MNTNITFTLYAYDTASPIKIPMEHAYVLSSDGHNWNCFGGGVGSPNAHVIRTANASSKWASLIYGPNEGPIDSTPAAGLTVRHDGVCQTAANRILVLAGVDARGTKGNALATVMFGKFGFNIQQYVDSVKSTGAQLLQSNPGEITAEDIQIVLGRISDGQTPDAELDLLHADLNIEEHTSLPDITDAQRNIFRPIYSDYQTQRNAAFLTASANTSPSDQIAFTSLKTALIGPWTECVDRLIAALGPDQFKSMFGVTPDLTKQLLSQLS